VLSVTHQPQTVFLIPAQLVISGQEPEHEPQTVCTEGQSAPNALA
jgi:hypothetical protein